MGSLLIELSNIILQNFLFIRNLPLLPFFTILVSRPTHNHSMESYFSRTRQLPQRFFTSAEYSAADNVSPELSKLLFMLNSRKNKNADLETKQNLQNNNRRSPLQNAQMNSSGLNHTNGQNTHRVRTIKPQRKQSKFTSRNYDQSFDDRVLTEGKEENMDPGQSTATKDKRIDMEQSGGRFNRSLEKSDSNTRKVSQNQMIKTFTSEPKQQTSPKQSNHSRQIIRKITQRMVNTNNFSKTSTLLKKQQSQPEKNNYQFTWKTSPNTLSCKPEKSIISQNGLRVSDSQFYRSNQKKTFKIQTPRKKQEKPTEASEKAAEITHGEISPALTQKNGSVRMSEDSQFRMSRFQKQSQSPGLIRKITEIQKKNLNKNFQLVRASPQKKSPNKIEEDKKTRSESIKEASLRVPETNANEAENQKIESARSSKSGKHRETYPNPNPSPKPTLIISNTPRLSRNHTTSHLPNTQRNLSLGLSKNAEQLRKLTKSSKRKKIATDDKSEQVKNNPLQPDWLIFSQKNRQMRQAASKRVDKSQLPRAYYCSMGGKLHRENQDSIAFQKNTYIICDGHGQYGHYVSQFVSTKLLSKKHYQFYNYPQCRQHKLSPALLTRAFECTAKDLAAYDLNTELSGSTALLVTVDSDNIYCANVGDCRAIISRANKEIAWLSNDHKPQSEQQKRRILASGGNVKQIKNQDGKGVGPYRVWNEEGRSPGLAVSRSFGDRVASACGVISTPQVQVFPMAPGDEFIVIGSDGFYEFFEPHEVVGFVKKLLRVNVSEREIPELLAKESRSRWKGYTETDDITCLIIFF